MKARHLFSVFILLFAAQAHSETTGYLSFEYANGQEKSHQSLGTFRNPGWGLIFSQEIASHLDCTAEARFRDVSRLEIEQAYLRVMSSNAFSLKLGLYLVPFGRYNTFNRPHQTMLVQVPLSVENLFPLSWRDLGILVEGKWSSFFYAAYLGNGLAESRDLSTAQQFKDNNKNKAKGMRLGLSLSRELDIAFSYYGGRYDEGNQRNLILKGADLSWISEGFQFISEYTKAELENPSGFGRGKAEGYYIQFSLDIQGFRPVGSFQKLKYDDPFHGENFLSSEYGGSGIQQERSRWTVGLVYFASQNVLIKVEYEFNREKEVEIKNNLLLVQMALSWKAQ
ncbi:MAG: hypothetical protein ACLFVG_02820 [Candidatus Aminicenantes bacterium]